ncbi:hypothetical protein [Allokutzneria oryzae]|uniref:DUF664 domain-containing protein n=1 Tax=Allokutzneria oryzae TaxID=1378989 RepID=A0ABV6A920_9PSEU
MASIQFEETIEQLAASMKHLKDKTKAVPHQQMGLSGAHRRTVHAVSLLLVHLEDAKSAFTGDY